MIVWGGSGASGRTDRGGRYDPVLDAWTPTTTLGAPTARSSHAAVWAGDEMIVWGGTDASGATNTGGRYDPRTDLWSPTSTVGAPPGRRFGHSAVWTGGEMIVWGGVPTGPAGSPGSGGLYDPIHDSWSPTSTIGAPATRDGHTAVWTGDEMVVWGGSGPSRITSGVGRYDPAADSWIPSVATGAPPARTGHTAIWTGSDMIVWGGSSGASDGGRYDPAADAWRATSTVGAPSPRSGHAAVWTGALMLVWGGAGTQHTGGRYGVDFDRDQDGFSRCGGDCDDSDASIHPGAVEVPGNLVDENCDGVVACDPSANWPNRGQFVSCVVRECRLLDDARSRLECRRVIK